MVMNDFVQAFLQAIRHVTGNGECAAGRRDQSARCVQPIVWLVSEDARYITA